MKKSLSTKDLLRAYKVKAKKLKHFYIETEKLEKEISSIEAELFKKATILQQKPEEM